MALVTLTAAVAGNVATAVFYNNNNTALLNQINGNLDATNLAALAVTTAKIATGAVTGPKIAMGSDAQGDVLYYNGSQYARLAAGTSGKFLKTQGSGANPKWDFGNLMQSVRSETGAYATGSTAIPKDDTVPQNTEGDQYLTLAITPKSATSILKITIVVNGDGNGRESIAALFQDSTVGALACAAQASVGTNFPLSISFTHYMTSGTTSSTTFNVRVGNDTATAFYFNGMASGTTRLFGGVFASSIEIEELAV